ncbi:hypothetical protein SVI_2597 [Shewanella violacea DSS12]|uniref:Uncharacterized protein n=1 Tax=Shewanella violacea (strain JCM 10179 / CIP 106290 / LMG 19151 / DSS12) TaxID=637905 RepID=D4ZLL9_SHEVD|nr:hypothetical protein SVI_2597 [Shewanella violacea DSS12]
MTTVLHFNYKGLLAGADFNSLKSMIGGLWFVNLVSFYKFFIQH